MNARTSLTLEDLAASPFGNRRGAPRETVLRRPPAAFLSFHQRWLDRGVVLVAVTPAMIDIA